MSNCLIGKTIMEMKIADDRMAIKFSTTEGDVVARCDAECCSHTWIESVELPANGFPCTVLSEEDLQLPDAAQDQYGDVIQFYGVRLVTDKGYIVIDYRNESNGYYGGYLVWPGDRGYYGGVYGQGISSENWVGIKDASGEPQA